MKKLTITIIAVMATLVALTATAERKIWMYSNQGNHISMDVTELDSISFEEPGYLTLTPTSKSLDYEGGRFTVSIETNKEWTASVNDKTALIISKESGSGDDEISVLASQNTDEKSYSAILTITLSNGQYGQVIVTVDGKPEPEATVKDICGNSYSIVTIGTQTWMAENMKCNKYDTESERAGATVSPGSGYGPHCNDGSSSTDATELTDEQRKHLGYLYSWAAAVGFATAGASYSQTTEFTSPRQGICPNGWHIPTQFEFDTMLKFVGDDNSFTNAGLRLKSETGWNNSANGIDMYGFNGLPAGGFNGTTAEYVGIGGGTIYWTASATSTYMAVRRDLNDSSDACGIEWYKGSGYSVRCIKNEEAIVKDICGNTYPIVTIGTQTWMAENLKCNKYDTESEAYNASWLTDNTIPTSNDAVYTPYFTDVTKKDNWDVTDYGLFLSESEISKLGYLYNWAAAVGVSDGSAVSTLSGSQGICPNGWHIPSKAEIDALVEYMGGETEGLNKIKSKSGWYNNQNGTDDYGFSLLPAGVVLGTQNPGEDGPGCIGFHASLQTQTTYENEIISAYYGEVSVDKNIVKTVAFKKHYGRSVRCVKD